MNFINNIYVQPVKGGNFMKDKIDNLTLKEKATLLVGHSTMSTLPIKEKGVKSVHLSDGPNGVRKTKKTKNALKSISKTMPSTCFPVGVTLCSTWNLPLIEKMGQALAKECINYDVNVLLGPAINIQRNPLCGRNFEYLSEDPYLAGMMGANLVKGIQSLNVGACIKHYACNNNERYRFVGDSILDKRALHEIYLKPFEIAVREASPCCVMTAYNRVNGVFASENRYLLDDRLRRTWKFDGLVMTDWGGIVHRDEALNNGCDLEMPGMNDYNIKVIYDAVKEGKISEDTLDKSVRRILKVREKTDIKEIKSCDFDENYRLALNIACEGAVLLKNDKSILPLQKDKKYLVVGGLFKSMRYQGSGSSLLNPAIIKDHISAFSDNAVDYEFILGYDENKNDIDENLENEAFKKAEKYDDIIIFAGLNDYVESEGFDRDNMSLPDNQLSLIRKLATDGKHIVIVLFTGSPVELPFYDKVDSILNMMLPGEAGGEATYKLLFGEVSPCGKLSQTWPYKYEDVPFFKEFTSSPNELYKESIFVGYRYYRSCKKEVRFPFGYGLSYNEFEYSNMTVNRIKKDIKVTFDLQNKGMFDGKEVVQLYVGKRESAVVRPALELKAFTKVELKAGEKKKVNLSLSEDCLKVFVGDDFVLENGEYQLYVGSSSEDIRLLSSVFVKGDVLKQSKYDKIYFSFLNGNGVREEDFEEIVGKKIVRYVRGQRPYTLETPIDEFDTFFGKIFKKFVYKVGAKQYKKAEKIKDPLEREREKKAGLFIMKLMPKNSLRSMSFSSSGKFSYSLACGVLDLVNGHFFSGIRKMFKKYKIKENKKSKSVIS